MKLISFKVSTADGPRERIGAVHGRNVVDLCVTYRISLLSGGLNDRGASSFSSAIISGNMC